MPWITLDLDGTLADWPFRHCVGPLLRPYFQRHPDAWALRRREFVGRMASAEPVRAFDWDDIHAVVCRELGLEPFPSVRELVEAARYDPALLFPDVAPAVGLWRERGWKVAVATNGYALYQGVILERLGFAYDRMLAPDRCGYAKPQPEFWRELDGEEVVHAGDILSQDVWGANAAGIKAAWVWRAMPEEWAVIPAAERAQRPELGAVLERELKLELESHGRPANAPTHLPRPDWVVADLLELAQAMF